MTSFFWIAAGLAAFGYFIGEGLKNFGNPGAASSILDDGDDHPQFIKQRDLHWHINIDKQDVESFLEKYPDVPCTEVNGNIYFPYKKLMEWLMNKEDF
ncbi:DNA-binding protein [Aquibacillus saliphilus]|uniref:DNA-binding protein n=1 Tax=Aquibacillus saliphilus TaxID=1909422 RepID=UPI001CF00CD6|nr:DNA-binding protein [Aquibacillus saliphilus]